MTSRTDSHGRTKVSLAPSNWIGIAISVVLAISGAAVSQVLINVRHDAELDERLKSTDAQLKAHAASVNEKFAESKELVKNESAHTREIVGITLSGVNDRVDRIEAQLREIERIVRPAPAAAARPP